VLVSDGGKSFAYLARGTDSTYRPLVELDVGKVGAACQDAGAILRRDDPEAYPRIERVVDPAGSVAEAVRQVAEAVDGLFNLARRNDLG
jgi:hypothetical protein